MVTLAQAKELKAGDTIHHRRLVNSDGTPQRYVVTSVKTWKTRPLDIEVRVKRGLYQYERIHNAEIYDFNLGDGIPSPPSLLDGNPPRYTYQERPKGI